jgi:hypothetical protein
MGLYAKLDKCEFHQSQVEFLGYIVSNNGVSMDPKKVQTIVDWKTPSTIRGVQCFLGFYNFYSIFIKSYSNIATPLISFTHKDKFKWTNELNKAFKSLKVALTTAPILIHVDLSKPFSQRQTHQTMPLELSYFNMEMTIIFILLHSILENFQGLKSIIKFMTRNCWQLLFHLKIGAIF